MCQSQCQCQQTRPSLRAHYPSAVGATTDHCQLTLPPAAAPHPTASQGFFRLKKDTGGGGLCGIATTASYPVKTTPNHDVPEVRISWCLQMLGDAQALCCLPAQTELPQALPCSRLCLKYSGLLTSTYALTHARHARTHTHARTYTHTHARTHAQVCDIFAFQECPVGSSCSCSFSLFGLLCLWHDCCPLEGGVTCGDLEHCCEWRTCAGYCLVGYHCSLGITCNGLQHCCERHACAECPPALKCVGVACGLVDVWCGEGEMPWACGGFGVWGRVAPYTPCLCTHAELWVKARHRCWWLSGPMHPKTPEPPWTACVPHHKRP